MTTAPERAPLPVVPGDRWRLVLCLMLVAFAMTIPDRHGITTIQETNTGVRIYAVQSWVHYGRWDLAPVLCRLTGAYTPLDLSVRDGLPMLQKAPGVSWLSVPFYAAYVAAADGKRLPTHWSQTALAWVVVLLPTLLACAAFARHLARRVGPDLGLLAAVTLLAASPLFIYGNLYMDYGLATALLLAGALLGRRREAWALAAGGFCLGLAGDVNYMFWVHGALVGAVELARRVLQRDAPARYALACVGGALVPLAALLAYNQVQWGSPFLTGYDFMNHELHRQRGGVESPLLMLGKALFLDAKYGIFLYAPWTVFGVAGLLTALRREDLRWHAITGLVMLGAVLVFTALWQAEFKDDAAFSRHMLAAFPWLALGLVALVQRVRDASEGRHLVASAFRGLLAASLALAVAYQFVTAWTFSYHPLQLPSPVWQLNLPLFVNGIHTPITDLNPWTVPGTDKLGATWGWVLFTALCLGCAFAVPFLGRVRAPAHTFASQLTGALATVLALALLVFGGLATNPVGPEERDLAKRLVAAGRATGRPLGQDEKVLVARVRQDTFWFKKISEEIVGSYFTRDDTGWKETGHVMDSQWCDEAGLASPKAAGETGE